MNAVVTNLDQGLLTCMVDRGFGGIVTISSIAAMLPGNGICYGATKAWASAFSESVGMAVRRRGVRMVAVRPGFVRTEFHSALAST